MCGFMQQENERVVLRRATWGTLATARREWITSSSTAARHQSVGFIPNLLTCVAQRGPVSSSTAARLEERCWRQRG